MTSIVRVSDTSMVVMAMTAIFFTSIVLIETSHGCREKYAMLQNLELKGWALQERRSRLLIEHSTWASYDRIEKIAVNDLKMGPPDFVRVILVPK